MALDQWLQVKALFREAAQLAPEARPAFLKEHCDDNAEVLRELQLLLESHDDAEDFIETPAIADEEVIKEINKCDAALAGRETSLQSFGRPTSRRASRKMEAV